MSIDPSLTEVVRTPLLIWISLLAYQNIRPDEFTDITSKHVKASLFDRYVQTMLVKSRTRGTGFPRSKSIVWLSWFASTIARTGRASLAVADLQVHSLPTIPEKYRERWDMGRMYFTVGASVFISGILGLLMFGKADAVLMVGVFGSSIGFLVWFSSYIMNELPFTLGPVQIVGLNAQNVVDRLPLAAWSILLVGAANWSVSFLIALAQSPKQNGYSSIPAYLAFAVFLFFVSVISGDAQLAAKNSIGELRSNLVLPLLISLAGILCGVFAGRGFGLYAECAFALVYAAIATLIFGGMFLFQQLAIRVFLSMCGFAPLRYMRFLDYAVECAILRKVAGGYTFVHRTLMEYFVALADKNESNRKSWFRPTAFSSSPGYKPLS